MSGAKVCLQPASAFTHAKYADILTSSGLVASQMTLLPNMMIMAMMLAVLTIKMVFMSSMWSASMSICSDAYEAEPFAFSFDKILTSNNLIETLLTGWSEGAYYVDEDDLPHLHLENLQTHHLTRVRLHYNHMALEILRSLKSGPDATF